jgi:hypothetical protein
MKMRRTNFPENDNSAALCSNATTSKNAIRIADPPSMLTTACAKRQFICRTARSTREASFGTKVYSYCKAFCVKLRIYPDFLSLVVAELPFPDLV